MGMIPMQFDEERTSKDYTDSSSTNGYSIHVERKDKFRFVTGYVRNISGQRTVCTLDAIDRPAYTVRIPTSTKVMSLFGTGELNSYEAMTGDFYLNFSYFAV